LTPEEKVEEERKRRFSSWRKNEVTQILFKKLTKEIEEKMHGIVWNNYDDPEIVKGYIRAYTNLLTLEMEDIYSDE
jgi:hypothetical protein